VGTVVGPAGTIAQQQLAKYRERGSSGPGGLLARIASGARGLGSASKLSHREWWPMTVHTEYQQQALQQLLSGRQLQDNAAEQSSAPAEVQQHGQAVSPESAVDAVDAVDAVASEQPVAAMHHDAGLHVAMCKDSYSWLASLACEVSPPPNSSADFSPRHHPHAQAAAAQPIVSVATVAVCTACTRDKRSAAAGSSHSSSRRSILPTGGAFSGACLPGRAGGIFGEQQFLVDLQGTGAAAALAGSAPVQPVALSATSAAAGAEPGSVHGVSSGDLQLGQDVRLAMSVLVSAWHEMVVNLRGMRQQLYVLMPDLVGAVQAGDRAAAYAFKQVG